MSAVPLPQDAWNALFSQVEKHLSQGEAAQALQLLESVPPQAQRQPEYFYLRGTAHAMEQNFHYAIRDLEQAVERFPGMVPAYLNLAVANAMLEYWAQAARAAEKFIKKVPPEAGGIDQAREILKVAQVEIAEKAGILQVPLEKFRQAALINEKVEQLLGIGAYKQAIRESAFGIHLIPGWASLRNNRALALFFSGKIDQAVQEEQSVLEKLNPENMHALGNLIMIYICSWQPEQAAPYLERLRSLLKHTSPDNLDMDKAIESLGIAEDDQALWELAQRLANREVAMLAEWCWYVLAAAAANTGHLAEAKDLLERVLKAGAHADPRLKPTLEAIKKALRKKQPVIGPCLTGRFAYIEFRQLWPYPIAQELWEGLEEDDEGEIGPFLKEYLSRYPFVAYAGKLLLWCITDQQTRMLGLDLLLASDYPEAHQEALRFATSQYGSDDERRHAFARLQGAGYLPAGETQPFWVSQKGEWTEVKLSFNEVINEYVPPCDPKALELVAKARKVLQPGPNVPENQDRSAQILQQALEIDPNCASALHNLGVIYLQKGDQKQGEALLQRSIRADPDYLFGYTSLAMLELERENYAACEDLLGKVFQAPQVPANAMLRAVTIQIRAAVGRGEYEAAEEGLEALRSFDPEFPELKELETMVNTTQMETRFQARWLAGVNRYHDRQRSKPVAADESLASSLDRFSREALSGTLGFWHLSTSGRKGEVISRLVSLLLEPDSLHFRLEKELTQDEREALIWILEADGVQALEAFTQRYEDDYDDSPYWQYHDPETTLGRLQMMGLLAVGTLDGRRVVVIPRELRPLLQRQLA